MGEGWGFYISGNYSWHCEPVDYSESPVARRALNLAWWYYFSKFIDLFDSVFFVLKMKFAHLSPLHVIHHSTLPFLCWWGPRFVGGGQSGFGPFLNSGVHTLMYLYYLLAACGPALKPYLWWKKYLTTIQLVQFVILFMAFYRQAYSKKKSVVKVDKNGNSDLATGNGQVANGHTSILANGGETDIRQRKLA